MATVWSPADSKLVRESNYLVVQAWADLIFVSRSYFFGVGNQALLERDLRHINQVKSWFRAQKKWYFPVENAAVLTLTENERIFCPAENWESSCPIFIPSLFANSRCHCLTTIWTSNYPIFQRSAMFRHIPSSGQYKNTEFQRNNWEKCTTIFLCYSAERYF